MGRDVYALHQVASLDRLMSGIQRIRHSTLSFGCSSKLTWDVTSFRCGFRGDPLCVIIRKETIRGRFPQVQVGDNMLRDACYQMIGLRKNVISTSLGDLQC